MWMDGKNHVNPCRKAAATLWEPHKTFPLQACNRHATGKWQTCDKTEPGMLQFQIQTCNQLVTDLYILGMWQVCYRVVFVYGLLLLTFVLTIANCFLGLFACILHHSHYQTIIKINVRKKKAILAVIFFGCASFIVHDGAEQNLAKKLC